MIYKLQHEPKQINSLTKSKLTWLSRYMKYDYVRIFKAGGWTEADAFRFMRFMNFMYPELKHAIKFNYAVGHSVGYIAKVTGMRKEDVNHCQHLACLFGILEKDPLLYSRRKKRPDRFHFKTGVSEQQMIDILRRLSNADIRSIKQLTKKNVEKAGFSDVNRIYRRERGRDRGIPFTETYAYKKIDGQLLANVVTSKPEELQPYLPPGIKPVPIKLPSGRTVYRFTGQYADRYLVAVLPTVSNDEGKYTFDIYPYMTLCEDDYHFLALRHRGKPLDSPDATFPHHIKAFIERFDEVPEGYMIVKVPGEENLYRFKRRSKGIPTKVWEPWPCYKHVDILGRTYDEHIAECADFDYFKRFANKPAYEITTRYPELLKAPDGTEWREINGSRGRYYRLSLLSPRQNTIPVLTYTHSGAALMWHFVPRDKVEDFIRECGRQERAARGAA